MNSVKVEQNIYPEGLDTMKSKEFDDVDVSSGQWQKIARQGLFIANAKSVF